MRMARRWLTPLMPMLMRISRVRRFVFRTISQTAFAYPDSPISAGSAGRVRAQPVGCGREIVCLGLEAATAEIITNLSVRSTGRFMCVGILPARSKITVQRSA